VLWIRIVVIFVGVISQENVMAKKESKGLLDWRAKQKEGAIMKPSTFKSIERKAAASGARDPKAVAGAAYWNTAEAKYKGRGKKK
jgi:hypothetical protein